MEEISNSGARVGYRGVETVDRRLAAADGTPAAAIPLLFLKAALLNYEGETGQSSQVLEQLRSIIESKNRVRGQLAG